MESRKQEIQHRCSKEQFQDTAEQQSEEQSVQTRAGLGGVWELWGREGNGNDLFLLCLSIRKITTILQMENLEIVTKYIENYANKKMRQL